MKLKYFVPTLIVCGFLMLTASISNAKPDYSKKEKKGCTFCHVKAGSKDLNDAGKYYKEHNHSLEGFKPAS